MLVLAVGLKSQTGLIYQMLGLSTSRTERRKQKCIKRLNMIREIFEFDKESKKELDGEGGENDAGLFYHSLKLPIEFRLSRLTEQFSYFGIIAAIFAMLILSIRFCIENFDEPKKERWNPEHFQVFLRFIAIAMALIVVSTPNGLGTSTLFSIAFSLKV